MPKFNSDLLAMPDDEFAKLNGPPEPEAAAPGSEAPVPEDKPEPVATAAEAEPEAEPEKPVAAEPESEPVAGESEEKEQEKPEPEAPVPPGSESEPEAAPEKAADKPEAPVSDPAKKAEAEPEAKVDAAKFAEYEAFFKRVMAPFKANGKTIQLQSPEEVISLMQMGANYTKKMQTLQKDRKLLLMLEQNGLLDENKLSFYIDLEKKHPEAIKKFLKDAKVDPVDFDASAEVKYQERSHAVSDQEANLHSAIDDLKSSEGGEETLRVVNSEWDTASKKVLWDNPELLSAIHAQRQNGVYSRISAELDRRKVLGKIGPNVPFLTAYKIVGDEMAAAGAFQPAVRKPAPSGQPPVAVRTPVAVRPAKTPATKAADNARVQAAAAPRSAPQPAKSSVNYLAMSDEEFLKLSNKVS